MKYQQKSFSIGYQPVPVDRTVCPRCVGPYEPKNVRTVWKLCKQHRSELSDERQA